MRSLVCKSFIKLWIICRRLTGVRYDAVDQTLYVDSKIGNFTSFLSTETGFGNVVYANGKTEVHVAYGEIPIKKIVVANS